MRIALAILLAGFTVSSGFAQERAPGARRTPPAQPATIAADRPVLRTAPMPMPAGQTLVAGEVPFTGVKIDPRRPYVAGRGHFKMVANENSFDASANVIYVQPHGGYSSLDTVQLNLNLPAGTHLVVCHIAQTEKLTYKVSGTDVPIQFTPNSVGEHDLTFVLEPEADGWTGFSLYSIPPANHSFAFRGCDVTPMQ